MTFLHQLAPGAVVGGEFRVVRQLGAGGMGSVFAAEQASTGKLRALKLMHPALVADAKLRERFEREARVSALIPSAHVVQVIGAGVDPGSGSPWIAMELLEGEDLAALLRRRGSVSPAELHDVYRQLCHALGAAHAAGIVHRDVKPENIFLARTQSASEPIAVRVLDFGIAKVAAEAITMSTAAIGTPLWMAPEQTDARAGITPAADVWALGLIAFAMLAGRMYWRVANGPGVAVPMLMREILFDPLALASARAAELGSGDRIPPGFDAWFARCVHREPGERFPTAAEAFAALGPALFGGQGAGIAITPAGSAASASAYATPMFTGPTMAAPGPAAQLSTGPTMASPGPAAQLSTGPTMASPGPADPAGASGAPHGGAPGWAYAPTGLAPPLSSQPPIAAPGPTLPSAGVTPAVAGALTAGAAPPAPRRRGRGALLAIGGAVFGAAVTAAVIAGAVRRGIGPRRPGPSIPEVPGFEQPAPPRVPVPEPPRPGPVSGGPAPTFGGATPAQNGGAAPTSAGVPRIVPRRPFNFAAAQQALQQKASEARFVCSGESGPRSVTVTVFFEPAGAAKRVLGDPQTISTPAGICVVRVFSGTRVPPFDPVSQDEPLQQVTTGVGLN